MDKSLSIIIPSHNDAVGLQTFLPGLIKVCFERNWRVFIINDCSKDETASILSDFADDVSVITNEKNLGYGASIKRGILAAETEWIATMDADGQHRVDDLVHLASLANSSCDAILGNRRSSSHAPLNRRPGKWILQRAANFITGQKIPDINCGLRVIRRDIMLRLLSITSDRFSFSTSTAICLLQLDCRVKFEQVKVEERIGKSNVRQVRDGFYTLLLITRLIVLFKPLRITLPAGLICITLACLNQMITFFNKGLDISEGTVFLGLAGLVIVFMALSVDQVSGLRRDILLHDIKLDQLRTDYCNSAIKEFSNDGA